MPSSFPSRYLAPAALLGALLAVVIVFTSSTGDDPPDERSAASAPSTTEGRERASTSSRTSTEARTTATTETTAGEGGTHTVEVGDTLGTIAEENDTTVEELQSLNPDVDPQSLTVGERIQLPG